MYQLYLKPHREEPLLRHHPWVFSGALQRSKESIPLGSIVTIFNHDGSLRLGQGVYEGGTIAVRMLTFGEEEIGEWRTFFTTRLSQAHQLRKTLLHSQDDRQTDCWRLCYGESDFIPGLVIDIYREVAVIQIHALSLYPLRQLIAEVLCELPELAVHYVYDKSVETLPAQTPSDWIMPNGYLGKAPSAEYNRTVQEYGYSFMPDWERGQKTGFFVDQRDNRRLVESYARGRNVLNICCYSGGFSVYALGGGAQRVVSIDSSARAISLCEESVAINFSSDPERLQRHEAVVADAFDYLSAIEMGAYDLIVLDPPAFVKQRNHKQQGLGGYRRLNELALRAIARGGLLFTFSCSQAVTMEEFTLAVMTAATLAGREVRILKRLGQSPCHPINIFYPEGEYLKGLLLYVS